MPPFVPQDELDVTKIWWDVESAQAMRKQWGREDVPRNVNKGHCGMDQTYTWRQPRSQVVWIMETLLPDGCGEFSSIVGLFACSHDSTLPYFKWLASTITSHPPHRIVLCRPNDAAVLSSAVHLPPSIMLHAMSERSEVRKTFSLRVLVPGREECIVCMANVCDRALLPCGHLFCAACVPLLKACPLCRVPIQRVSNVTSLQDFRRLSKRDWCFGHRNFSIFSWAGPS